jgi:hypothetical protein
MIARALFRQSCGFLLVLLTSTILALAAGYKIRPWTPRDIESYPAKLTSEGVTIAVDPLFTDALAAQVFDLNDMVARGIMPLGIVIFNSNAFPVDVEGPTIELQREGDRQRSLDPLYAVRCMYEKKPTRRFVIPSPIPIPTITIKQCNADACKDFGQKYLGMKRVEAHATAGGFLFMPVKGVADLRQALASARIYIRNVYNGNDGTPLLFFEIDLKLAIDAAARTSKK